MTATLNDVPLPLSDPMVETRVKKSTGNTPEERIADIIRKMSLTVTRPWADFFTNWNKVIEQAPARVKAEALTSQSASIGATDFTGGGLSAGLYRLSYYTQLVQAGSVSSELTIALDWRFGGQTLTFTGTLLNANTLTTYQNGTQFIRIDSLSPVRYAVTRASVGGTPMLYDLFLTLEEIQA